MLDLYPETIDAYDIEGLTPLHQAAKGGKADMVELLLKYDPKAASKALTHPNFMNVTSYNLPLHSACYEYICAKQSKVARVLFDVYP